MQKFAQYRFAFFADVNYIKPLDLSTMQDAKSRSGYLDGSQTLPFGSKADKSRIKQRVYVVLLFLM